MTRPRRHVLHPDDATAVAADRLADLLDAVEMLFDPATTRPKARRALDRIAVAADDAERAARDTTAPWVDVRTACLVQFMREAHPLPRVMELTVRVHPNDT